MKIDLTIPLVLGLVIGIPYLLNKLRFYDVSKWSEFMFEKVK